MSDQFRFDQLGLPPDIELNDLLALFTGDTVNGLRTQKATLADVFAAMTGNFVHIAYAEDNSGTNFSLTFDGNKTHMAFLVSDVAIENPTAADFTGSWVPIVSDELQAHLTDTENPHEVAYDEVGDGSGGTMTVVSQAEAEAGTSSTPHWWTARRVQQAISALSGSGGTASPESIRQITERSGTWGDSDGDAIDRTWGNPTLFFSTSDPPVLPPINQNTGMREHLDRYERIHDAPPALVVVADANAPNAVDTALHARLEELGFNATYQSEGVTPPSASEYVMAVVSESTTGSLDSGWASSTIPVIVGDLFRAEALNLVSTTVNIIDTESSATITLEAHAATGDLGDGQIDMYTSSNTYTHIPSADLAAGATEIAHKDGAATSIVAAVYESGSTLTTGTAPARRTFSGHMFRSDLWADEGRDLFDAMVYWAAGWKH